MALMNSNEAHNIVFITFEYGYYEGQANCLLFDAQMLSETFSRMVGF
jgi:hypothetical protein